MHPLATNRFLWLIVPLVAFGGIVISQSMQSVGVVFPESVFYLPVDPGVWGNIVGSFLIAGIAYIKPRRDIVSLLTPIYAVIIFLADDQIRGLLVLQVMYAFTLTIMAIRLEKLYSGR
jgi:hypothetical protein